MPHTPGTPPVSIIIPYRNRQDTLPRTLASIAACTLRPLEVILVDNGSEDASSTHCLHFAEKADSGITVHLLSEPCPGAARARNTGLRKASAPWVYFFDSDDEISPEFLQDALAEAKENPLTEIVAAATKMVYPDGREQKRKVYPNASVTDQILTGMLATQGMLFRKDFCMRINGWKDNLRIWDDWELGIRALAARPHIVWLTGKAYHRIYQHEESITGNDFSSRQQFLSEALIAADEAIRLSPRQTDKQKRMAFSALKARAYILSGIMEHEGNHSAAAEIRHHLPAQTVFFPPFIYRTLSALSRHGIPGTWWMFRLLLHLAHPRLAKN